MDGELGYPERRLKRQSGYAGATQIVDSKDLPPWLKQQGARRVMHEFQEVIVASSTGDLPISELDLKDDKWNHWILRLRKFDEQLPGGVNLNADIAEMQRRYGDSCGSIDMEVHFPENYPDAPPFVRVIKPRMMWYTGHVTAGGSVCMQPLTLGEGPQSWRRDYTVLGVLGMIFSNFVDAESTFIRTAANPKGAWTGPLRIDLDGHYTSTPLRPYSNAEARAAFDRALRHHRSQGW